MGKAVKKDKKEKESKKSASGKSKKKKGVKGIIRIAGTDVFGEVPLTTAVMRVKGVSHTTGVAISRIISEKFSIPANIDVGDLDEKQLSQIDDILSNLSKHLPPYLLNRRKNPENGKDNHVIMNDLIFANRQDIEKEKKIYSWKGYRHAYGKKVRGQRTKNTGRHGRAVGVVRKSIQAAKGAPVKKEEKKK